MEFGEETAISNQMCWRYMYIFVKKMHLKPQFRDMYNNLS